MGKNAKTGFPKRRPGTAVRVFLRDFSASALIPTFLGAGHNQMSFASILDTSDICGSPISRANKNISKTQKDLEIFGIYYAIGYDALLLGGALHLLTE